MRAVPVGVGGDLQRRADQPSPSTHLPPDEGRRREAVAKVIVGVAVVLSVDTVVEHRHGHRHVPLLETGGPGGGVVRGREAPARLLRGTDRRCRRGRRRSRGRGGGARGARRGRGRARAGGRGRGGRPGRVEMSYATPSEPQSGSRARTNRRAFEGVNAAIAGRGRRGTRPPRRRRDVADGVACPRPCFTTAVYWVEVPTQRAVRSRPRPSSWRRSGASRSWAPAWWWWEPGPSWSAAGAAASG